MKKQNLDNFSYKLLNTKIDFIICVKNYNNSKGGRGIKFALKSKTKNELSQIFIKLFLTI